jgi:hypothetical protein
MALEIVLKQYVDLLKVLDSLITVYNNHDPMELAVEFGNAKKAAVATCEKIQQVQSVL